MSDHVMALALLLQLAGGDVREAGKSLQCTLTEKRQATGGMLVASGREPQKVAVCVRDGGFAFTYGGRDYVSPQLNAQGVAQAPNGPQFIHSRAEGMFSVEDGDRYLEIGDCSPAK
jgi:hypothetical protein